MRNVWLIARREYLQNVRARSFVLTTIGVPVLILALGAVAYLSINSALAGKHIAIASNDAALAQSVKAQLVQEKKNGQMSVDVYAPATDADRKRLDTQVQQKTIEGVLTLQVKSGVVQPAASFESRGSADYATSEMLENAVDHATTQREMSARGMSTAEVDALMKHVHIETLQNKNGRRKKSSAAGTFWTAYAMAFLLSFTGVMYGMNVGRSVIEEKSSRIFEVMLATVRPEEMMAGKLVGVGAVGLTQLGIWLVAAALALASPLATLAVVGGTKIQINGVQVVLFVVYFLLGYLFNSVLSAALAATTSSEQEYSQFWPANVIPIWLSFGMLPYITGNPDSWLSIAASWFPPTAPIVMFLRMGAQMPPAWQFIVSIAILVVTIYLMILLASRIYRVGILMYGKRATLPEIMRWLRYS